MRTVVLRRLRPADAPAVRRLVERTLREYGLWREHRSQLEDLDDIPGSYVRPGGEFLVAVVNGRVVGSGALKPLSKGRAEIRRMYLDPRLRGQGAGRRMLERLARTARRRGFGKLVLETSLRFEDAIRLYLRAGFSACVRDGGCCSVLMFRDP